MVQITLLDILEPQREKTVFNPIAAYAMRGSGFVKFLKKEYGVGGFGFWSNDPCVVHQGMYDASGHKIEYNDENGKMQEIKITYATLEREIDRLIASGKYMEER